MSKSKSKPAATPPAPQFTIDSLVDEAARLGIVAPPDEMEAIAVQAYHRHDPLGYLQGVAEGVIDKCGCEVEGTVAIEDMQEFASDLAGKIAALPPGESLVLPPGVAYTFDDDPLCVAIAGIPLGEIPPGAHVSRRVDMHLAGPDRQLAETLKRIFEGLYEAGEKLPGNRPIRNTADAIRWLLYRVQAAAAPAAAK